MSFFILVEISSDLDSIENCNVCLECNNSAKINNHIMPKICCQMQKKSGAGTKIHSEPFPFCTSFSSLCCKMKLIGRHTSHISYCGLFKQVMEWCQQGAGPSGIRDFLPQSFQDKIQMKIFLKRSRISWDYLLQLSIWSISYILDHHEKVENCMVIKSNLDFWEKCTENYRLLISRWSRVNKPWAISL